MVETAPNPVTDNPDYKNVVKLRRIIRDALNYAWDLQLGSVGKDLVKSYLEAAQNFLRMNFYELKPIPEYGDHMTMKEWVDGVTSSCFIDYDGHGYLATEHSMSNIVIVPSDLVGWDIPKWWTHVVWFNR
jgi:hypothetical protein